MKGSGDTMVSGLICRRRLDADGIVSGLLPPSSDVDIEPLLCGEGSSSTMADLLVLLRGRRVLSSKVESCGMFDDDLGGIPGDVWVISHRDQP